MVTIPPPHAPLCYLSIDEAAARIRDRTLSPVELTRAYLARIQALDSTLHSYLEVLTDDAMSGARTAEREIVAGGYRGPLHGIPIALKDLFDVRGVRTTFGSRVFRERRPTTDATVTARLHAAGCVLLGKLIMSELAMTGPPGFAENARNPWNVDHLPGGSSSGSGVAVAAGLCAGALGSDTAGSIRSPAAHNGVVGLMPTYGRVSRHGVMPLSSTLDHVGPMTRTVEDAALILRVIAGRDPKDPSTSSTPVPDYRAALTADVRGLRVGVLREEVTAASEAVRSLVSRAIQDLEHAGARVQTVTIPDVELAQVANAVIYLSEGFSQYRQLLRDRGRDIGPAFRVYAHCGALLTSSDYVQAQRLRSRLRREILRVFESIDVLALPVTQSPAGAARDYDPFALTPLKRRATSDVFNLTACPAISVPCGFTPEGLPVGLQLAARPFDELTLLNAAYAYQQCHRWHDQHPPLVDE